MLVKVEEHCLDSGIYQVITEHLLHSRHCAKHWGFIPKTGGTCSQGVSLVWTSRHQMTSQVIDGLTTFVIYTIKRECIWESESWRMGRTEQGQSQHGWRIHVHRGSWERVQRAQIPKSVWSEHPAECLMGAMFWEMLPWNLWTIQGPTGRWSKPFPQHPATPPGSLGVPQDDTGNRRPWASDWPPARLDTHASYFHGAANSGKYVV